MVVPGRSPVSISVWVTQPRKVSGLMPSCCPIRLHAPVRVIGSYFASSTIRTARSRSSSGYFLGATIDLVPPGLMVSIKPGTRHRYQRRASSEPGLALIGVDNPTTRQLLDAPRWDLAIDLGLGHGHRDFSEIALHSVDPSHPAETVAAWAASSSRPEAGTLPAVPAFDAYQHAGPLERCGVVELAGRAVGASFVGVLAAGLGVNEVLRRLAGAPGTAVLTLDAHRPAHARGALANSTPTLTAIDAC